MIESDSGKDLTGKLHSQGNDVTSGYQDMYPLEIRFRNNNKLLNIETKEKPINIDSLTPEQMKELPQFGRIAQIAG